MTSPPVDLEARWRLHPSVSVRREPFGALLYHYGTRRLTFVKDTTLVDVLVGLAEAPSAEAAMAASGVPEDRRSGYAGALERLVATDMVLPAADDGA